MNYYIQQSIHIHFIKIGGVTNSSVLQIGSAGIIKPQANLYNTGGFTKPAPAGIKPGGQFTTPGGQILAPSVPLQAAIRTT
ncbi:spore germination protein GerPB [Neobacillus cucumis]|jgi:spore germination protein PB|uniref:spore germination protein GerPB n=1 Tax=Neobacillus cucumis TaxID=1740721 RepID=UPI00196305C8|nr:spore germination protein GerPB [Neobacillus cucumis]MBM7653730.1 spore germination protein PB [Neobacillus cucumis]MED4225131.1 spore germination protein GerPB [Neobacillus cucumis]